VALERGDRRDVDDVPVAGGDQPGEQTPGHAHETEDVGLVHGQPLVVDGVGDRELDADHEAHDGGGDDGERRVHEEFPSI
jgi:hypothetical protein